MTICCHLCFQDIAATKAPAVFSAMASSQCPAKADCHLGLHSFAATRPPAVLSAVAICQCPDFLGVKGGILLRPASTMLTMPGYYPVKTGHHFRFQSLAATKALAVPIAVASSQYPDFLGVVGAMLLRLDSTLLTMVGCGSMATAV